MPNRDASTGRFTSSSSSGGFNLGKAYATIEIDSSGVKSGMDNAKKSVSNGLKDIGSGLQSLGSNLTLIGAPFLGLAAVAQNAFAEMDDAADQLGAVIKSTGGAAGVTRGEALRLGVELQNLTGITRAQIVGGEAMLLTFTNIGKDTFPRATRAVTDLSVAMKQDIKSSAIQLGKALNDPVKGITALTRVGVTFTQSQKDMIQAMMDVGNIAGAQGIILTEIEKEFGGSAAAAVDPIDHLKASLNDLAIDIGVSLQPVLEAVIPIIQGVVKSIGDWFSVMTDSGDNTVGIILAIGAGLAILGPIVAVLGAGLGAIGAVIGVVLSPIGLIVAAVVGLFVAIQNNFLGIRDFLQPVIDAIGNFFAHFSDNIKLYGSLAWLYFQYYIVNNLQKFWDVIKPAFDSFLAWFQTDGLPAINTALNWFKDNVLQPVINVLVDIWKTVSGGLIKLGEWFFAPGGGLDQAKQSLNDFKTNVIDPVIKTLQDIWKKVQPFLNDLKNGIKSVFDWIGANVIQPVIDVVDNLLLKLHELTGNTQIQGSAVGSELSQWANRLPSGNAGGVVPIPPVGGGSSLPITAQGRFGGGQGFTSNSSDLVMHQPVFNINANTREGGQVAMAGAMDELEKRYRGRGN